MRFTCEKNMLVQGLNIAGRTVAQKSSLTAIEGILCRAGDGLTLTGYNMETAITYQIEAEVADMGACVLPAKLFGDIIRRLPEGPVTVVVDDNFKVSIRAGYASFTLGPKHILFQVGKATLVCRLLEGEFLDWRRVVPTDCPIKLIASVSDLASSVERVGLIVSEKYKSPVRCMFGNNELIMRTNTTIGAAEDKCSFAGDGKELEIGFNVRYLADALRVIPSDEVTLELTNGLSPIVLTPADDKQDFAYMVLPVRIKNG